VRAENLLMLGETPNTVAIPSYRFATVTAVYPLAVRMDGDTVPLIITPISIVGCQLADRVLCMIYNKQVIVMGRVQSSTARSRPLPMAWASGQITVPGSGASSVAVAITFPVGMFTEAPELFGGSPSSANAAFAVSFSGVTTAGATLRLTRDAGAGTFSSDYVAKWLAFQM
jgi:hypothetical protein